MEPMTQPSIEEAQEVSLKNTQATMTVPTRPATEPATIADVTTEPSVHISEESTTNNIETDTELNLTTERENVGIVTTGDNLDMYETSTVIATSISTSEYIEYYSSAKLIGNSQESSDASGSSQY